MKAKWGTRKGREMEKKSRASQQDTVNEDTLLCARENPVPTVLINHRDSLAPFRGWVGFTYGVFWALATSLQFSRVSHVDERTQRK